jgi:chemotaxis protein methyltransferase CheR
MNEHTSANSNNYSINKMDITAKFTHFIRERLGIIIHPHQTNDLNKLIAEACKKFKCSTYDYLTMLKESPEHSPIIEHLILGITIGETYFFRDSVQMHLLKDNVLPDLITRKRKENNHILRIWSAGSSSGEEIFTIAMLLCDILPDINAWTLNLLGTDINTDALKKALNGVYSEWSMRSIPERYKQRYFTINDQKYKISQSLREMVTFLYLNLNENVFPSLLNDTNAQDLIICRNVLIYFDQDRGTDLMKKFRAALVPGGMLILGASDPVYTTNTDLIFKYKQGALFVRPTEADLKNDAIASQQQIKHIPVKIKETSPSEIKKPIHLPKPSTSKELSLEEQKNTVIQLLNEGEWEKTLDVVHSYRKGILKSAFLLSAEATALANLGKLDKAADLCLQSLAIDSTNINTHFLLAMVLTELNRTKEAEIELRKTLFLDHQFVMGHFQLGLLLIKNKQSELGLKCLYNALSIVKNHDASQQITKLDNIDYGNLAEILEHEIELHISAKGVKNAKQK